MSPRYTVLRHNEPNIRCCKVAGKRWSPAVDSTIELACTGLRRHLRPITAIRPEQPSLASVGGGMIGRGMAAGEVWCRAFAYPSSGPNHYQSGSRYSSRNPHMKSTHCALGSCSVDTASVLEGLLCLCARCGIWICTVPREPEKLQTPSDALQLPPH